MALNDPNKKETNFEKPFFLKGILIALPSGKFWIAIAIVKAIAEAKELLFAIEL